jgi:hypothetical protein
MPALPRTKDSVSMAFSWYVLRMGRGVERRDVEWDELFHAISMLRPTRLLRAQIDFGKPALLRLLATGI